MTSQRSASLPFARPSNAASDPETRSVDPRPTVLVVEDESLVAMDIQAKLRSLGFAAPDFATSGREAIQKAERLAPQLVLMDIRLRGNMDGISAAEEITERYKIPVIYLTAYGDRETLERAKATGPYGFLLKPFDERDLRAAVEIALHRHESDRALRQAHEKIQAHADRTGRLAALGLQALQDTDVGQLISVVSTTVSNGVGASLVQIYETGEGGLRMAGGTVDVPGSDGQVPFDSLPEPFRNVLRGDGPVTLDASAIAGGGMSQLLQDDSGPDGAGVLVIGVPGEARPWGVLVARGRAFGADDIGFVQSAVNVLGAAMDRRRAEGTIQILSAPILPVAPGLLMVPLMGDIDPGVTRRLTDQLLRRIRSSRARVVVVDVTAAATIDSRAADDLLKLSRAVVLVGAELILAGVTSELAQAAIRLGLNFNEIRVIRDLQEGIEQARRLLRLPV